MSYIDTYIRRWAVMEREPTPLCWPFLVLFLFSVQAFDAGFCVVWVLLCRRLFDCFFSCQWPSVLSRSTLSTIEMSRSLLYTPCFLIIFCMLSVPLCRSWRFYLFTKYAVHRELISLVFLFCGLTLTIWFTVQNRCVLQLGFYSQDLVFCYWPF